MQASDFFSGSIYFSPVSLNLFGTSRMRRADEDSKVLSHIKTKKKC